MEGADTSHWRTYTSLDNRLSLVTQSFLACDDDFFSSLSELAWIWFLRRQLRRVCPHLTKFALWIIARGLLPRPDNLQTVFHSQTHFH